MGRRSRHPTRPHRRQSVERNSCFGTITTALALSSPDETLPAGPRIAHALIVSCARGLQHTNTSSRSTCSPCACFAAPQLLDRASLDRLAGSVIDLVSACTTAAPSAVAQTNPAGACVAHAVNRRRTLDVSSSRQLEAVLSSQRVFQRSGRFSNPVAALAEALSSRPRLASPFNLICALFQQAQLGHQHLCPADLQRGCSV